MLLIRNAEDLALALNSPIDPKLKHLLALRRDQLLADTGGDYDLGELVHFVVAEPFDRIAAIETDIGFPLFTEPAFEWVQDHGDWLEGVVILSDDGFGIALFVPDAEGIDPRMLTILRDQSRIQHSRRKLGPRVPSRTRKRQKSSKPQRARARLGAGFFMP